MPLLTKIAKLRNNILANRSIPFNSSRRNVIGAASLSLPTALMLGHLPASTELPELFRQYPNQSSYYRGTDAEFSPVKESPIEPEVSQEYVYKFLQSKGIPPYKQESLRRQSKVITALDPDLLANRSMAFATKIREQQKRNYTSFCRSYLDSFVDNIEEKFFFAKFPFLKRWL